MVSHITKVLMSLPEKYRQFIAAWEYVPASSQTVEELMARLLVEEERSKSTITNTESECVALNCTTNKSSAVKCFGCGKIGHFKKDCRAKLQCFYCKKYGHSIKMCRLRLNKQKFNNDLGKTESNKSVRHAMSFLLHDIENVILKIYAHFSHSAVRREKGNN